MGRMLQRGHGRRLYHRPYQRQVLAEVYPTDAGVPGQRSDVEWLMFWCMGYDDATSCQLVATMLAPLGSADGVGCLAVLQESHADLARTLGTPGGAITESELSERVFYPQPPPVGGPLYPPINAFLYYPVSYLAPQTAYRVLQVVQLLLAFVGGLAAVRISGGRWWWPVASTAILIYPGFLGSLNLAQNAALTLAIVLWGWALVCSGREIGAGMIWGLLAFKPVWAMAFFLVPLLSGRWRMCLAMVGTGAVLAAATLPVVGLQSWRDWLHVGADASTVYKADIHWIFLSRDLLSLPRRLLDFSDGMWQARVDNVPAAIVGWVLLVAVLEVTLRLAILRPRTARRTTGFGPAFLFLAAWLTCFHFMYYDTLLSFVPVFLLFVEPGRYLQPRYLALVSWAARGFPGELWLPAWRRALLAPPRLDARCIWTLNPFEPTWLVVLLVLTTIYQLREPPMETYCLLVLWAWAGWKFHGDPAAEGATAPDTPSARDGPGRASQQVELSADVAGTHQRLADQDRPDTHFLQT